MVFTIEAIDNEFAVATGSNVGTSPGRSRFDNPPNGSQDLTVTTKAGDNDPLLFEIGDVYDVSWGGSGGGGTILNAVVVRSDDPPGGGSGGVIVFEGTDANGDVAQVVWTPGVDLEDWYWTNYNPSAEPQFYTTDQNANYTHEFICFEKSVRIATPRGLQPAATLRAGETVCTWGGTKRVIRWVGQKSVPAQSSAAPIRFDVGTIGNFAPLKLSPQHRVLIASREAELHFDAPEVLVPAISLVDKDRIRQVPRKSVGYVHILLDQHDILVAEGAPCESLLPSFRTRDCLSAADRQDIRRVLGPGSRTPARNILRRHEAEMLRWSREVPQRASGLF